jgi:hypothetical protein
VPWTREGSVVHIELLSPIGGKNFGLALPTNVPTGACTPRVVLSCIFGIWDDLPEKRHSLCLPQSRAVL